MSSRSACFVWTLVAWLAVAAAHAAELKPPLEAPAGFEHDKWGTKPHDILQTITAFTVSFDSADDGDEIADVWAIPHWVGYEMKALEAPQGGGPDRPDWMTDTALRTLGIAPDDKSYHFSDEWRAEHPESKFLGYDRGHMCMKQHAFRIGEKADWNTHTLLNACPQRAELNRGIWLDLEKLTGTWADTYDRVWIVTGPVIYGRKPLNWLGQAELGEVMVAIPDAFFKIVVRPDQNQDGLPDVLAFVYPQRGVGYKVRLPETYNHLPYLTNVNAIEAFTGLDFFTTLSEENQEAIEKRTATELWPVESP